VILTGRGLGFQARPGQTVNPAQIVRIFVPTDGHDPDHLAQLLAGIPPEHIALVARLWRTSVGQSYPNPALIVAWPITSASPAANRCGMEMEYPLLAEVQNLYAEEYTSATAF